MCFFVPLTQAIATTIYRVCTKQTDTFVGRNLKSLELMLWGGTVMLIVDHAINGELFAWTPLEMLRVGVPMAVGLTLVWLIYALWEEKKAEKALTTK